ncbi:MAG TPA: hypothetical protein VJK71_06090 [Gemmatimonadales bacterium]|nr:hypothetical protein [Gemmatimonadales bacterium]
MTVRLPHVTLPALLVAVLAGCSGSGPSEPDPGEERPESGLFIIRLAANAPPLFNSVASFWAYRGRDAKGELFFQQPGGTRGEKFVELDLSDRSLLAYPDGTLFAEGDSVLITIRAVDPGRVLIEFEPSGLRFNPEEPAELEIRYSHADEDFDDDGDEDEDDAEIEQVLGIWRQALLGGPFVRLGTVRIEDLKELEARLLGFSRLAIAY